MKLYEPQEIRKIKNKFGFRFSRSLGQNFLTDKAAIDGILEGAGVTEKDLAIEIGPGIGVLTQALAEKAGRVIAIEIDEGLCEIMKYTLSDLDNVTVISEDILKIDIANLIEKEKGEHEDVKIVGNLPYYITTPIMMKLLDGKLPVSSITVMMQKEVAERIVSGPGSKAYGALSIAVQYRADVTMVEEVPKESFMPSPKVDSAVIRLDMLAAPRVRVSDEALYFRTVRAAFGQRRKTLLNSISSAGIDKDDLRDALSSSGISPERRAETLSLSEYAKLTDDLKRKGY